MAQKLSLSLSGIMVGLMVAGGVVFLASTVQAHHEIAQADLSPEFQETLDRAEEIKQGLIRAHLE